MCIAGDGRGRCFGWAILSAEHSYEDGCQVAEQKGWCSGG